MIDFYPQTKMGTGNDLRSVSPFRAKLHSNLEVPFGLIGARSGSWSFGGSAGPHGMELGHLHWVMLAAIVGSGAGAGADVEAVPAELFYE